MASSATTNAAIAVDPSLKSSSPSAAGHSYPLSVPGDYKAPPSPCSTPPPPPIPFPDHSDRSPRKPPPAEDVGPSSSDAAARSKKPAWRQPINGSIEPGASAVMGSAASWPALSESAKATSKSQSTDALRTLSDGPVSALLGPVVSNSSPKTNLNPSSTPNHVAPARQKSMRRSGSSGGSDGSAGLPDSGMGQSSPPSASAPMLQLKPDKQALTEHSPRDQPTKNTDNWDHGSRGGGSESQVHDGGDHHRGFGGNRRWNNGGGSGSHHNNYGNRHDGYRRNSGGRDAHMPHRNPRPYLRLPVPPVAPPFLSPHPQGQPFGNSMVFSDMSSPILYVAPQPSPVGIPFVPHPAVPPPMFVPAIDPQRAGLLNQIDYYFSNDNLCRDVYLRQNMDEQGWVPIPLIAGFNRVRQLTNNIDFILDTVRLSNIVEVQGEKIRKRNDWQSWILPRSNNQFAATSALSPTATNFDGLASRLQSVGLEGAADQNSTSVPNVSEVLLGRSASGNLRN